MNEVVTELYDYSALRSLNEATAFVPELTQPVVVLGGSQSSDVLEPARTSELALRRRRGGGGLVLLQPGDVWIDWLSLIHISGRNLCTALVISSAVRWPRALTSTSTTVRLASVTRRSLPLTVESISSAVGARWTIPRD